MFLTVASCDRAAGGADVKRKCNIFAFLQDGVVNRGRLLNIRSDSGQVC